MTLERIDGVIAYDITEPTAPRFAFFLDNIVVDPTAARLSNRPKSAACAGPGVPVS